VPDCPTEATPLLDKLTGLLTAGTRRLAIEALRDVMRDGTASEKLEAVRLMLAASWCNIARDRIEAGVKDRGEEATYRALLRPDDEDDDLDEDPGHDEGEDDLIGRLSARLDRLEAQARAKATGQTA
jgi:hypothetical protein